MATVSPHAQRVFAEAPEIEVNVPNIAAALDMVFARAQARKGYTLFTVNLDHLVKMKIDPAFREAYLRATLVLADGWPIVWLLRRQGEKLQRATGADLIEPLCARAAELALPVFFIGPSEASLTSALEILSRRHDGLRIAGACSAHVEISQIDAAADAYAARLRESGARLCVLSVGAPKQELLADALRRRCPQIGFICAGAALDFISGCASRAPGPVQRLGLEWLWRMSCDPKRLGARYVACLGLFAELALRCLLGGGCGLRGQLSAPLEV
ncbi:MAG TPA: WecB/TagA/CpsF family glycosyltransferase [Methylocystis sp.]|nr:WecB/TagA/CpsF family glycosyltransferase [Methylocystis sp.]